MVKQKDEFHTYDNLEDSVRDYGKFLKQNKRYKPLLEANSFDEQIEALAGAVRIVLGDRDLDPTDDELNW